MTRGFADMQKIADNLDSIGKELEDIQNRMKEGMAARLALLEKIANLISIEESEIVIEKTHKVRLRQRKTSIK